MEILSNGLMDKSEAKYLVCGVYGCDDSEFAEIMDANKIFKMMDMEDCSDVRIDLWKINGRGEALTECQFLGKWVAGGHKDPQRMEIRSDAGIEAVGYGTEH